MPETALDLVGIEKIVSVDYIESVMRCYREGRVAVPVEPGGDAPAGHAFAERITPVAGGGWFTQAQAPIDEDRPAHVAFSSGTTGTPKAVLLSHRALADVTTRLITAMGADGEISEYLGVPPTYSFGLARARVVAAVGGRLFVPGHGFDPTEFARMLEAGEVNALSAVPTLLRVLIANPELIARKVARKLRWLEIGSQPMSGEEKQAVRRLFPAARIVQHYGLTEASRTTFLDIQEANDAELDSVGKPIGRTEVRIDGDGLIAIRGPHVADGLLTADGLQPIVDADGWLHTNDLGHIDEAGFLFFDGRADFLLNVGGIKVPGELFEQRLIERMTLHAAAVAVAARPDPLRGQVVMVAHLADVPAALVTEHARAIGATFGIGIADVAIVEVPEIPRTDTGKVQRALLTERHGLAAIAAAAGPAPSDTPAGLVDAVEGEMSEREAEIAAIWRDTLGVAGVTRDSSFFDIGGDSLSAITVMLKMERAGIPKEITQQIFEGRTIAQIAANMGGEVVSHPPVRRAEASDAITMVRGLLVGVILCGHWLPFFYERAGSLSQWLYTVSNPFFRFGTPGFAMVFGIGLGFFSLPMVTGQPDRLKANMRTNVMILAGGVGAMAVVRALYMAVGPGFEPIWPSRIFFNVLAAYLLLVATAVPILRFVAARRYPLLTVAIAAAGSLLVSELLRVELAGAQTRGFLDLARLLLVAKYGYCEMLGYVLTGMAMGIWIQREHEADDLARQASLAGVAVMLLGLMLTYTLNLQATWFENNASTNMLVTFAGAVLLLFGIILGAIQRGYARGPARVPFRLLMGVGILAFLFYVGQELVMSGEDLLLALNLPMAVALGIPMALFVGSGAYGLRRIYRLYYG
jgi:hypothetical protein